jgi:hypothetical protein
MDALNRSAHCVYRTSVTERLLTQQVASRRGLSVSAYIREAVMFYILLDGEASEVLQAADVVGPECLDMVRKKLRDVEWLIEHA